MKKLISILVAFAMMATLAVCMAFATGDSQPAAPADTDANAEIYKVLWLPDASVKPDGETEFTFAIDGVATNTVSKSVADTAAGDNATFSVKVKNMATDTIDGKDMLVKAWTAQDFFTFTQPGEYKYTVTETTQPFTDPAGDEYTETLDMNIYQKTYTLRFYVNSDLEVTDATISDGTNKVKPKVDDPTKIDPSDPEGGTFVNKYEKTLTEANDPSDPTKGGALNVSKTVGGDYGDKNEQFSFTLNLAKPATTDEDKVAATIYRKADSTVTPSGAVEITYGQDYNFTLADGEKLVIETLPLGTDYTVTENIASATNADKYTVTINGDEATTASGNFLAQTNNAVLNDFDDDSVTPTGILMNNLPYIVLALVAIGGLVAYVIVRRRQNDEA